MDFVGFPTGTIENGFLRIDYLRRGSLRLVRLMLGDSGTNLFAELPDEGWHTSNGYYRIFGGHRFWVAPEREEVTYLPEPEEVTEESIPGGVRLIQPVERRSGLQKICEIRLAQGEAAFTIRHILANQCDQAVSAAAWAISQFPLGGIAVLPQPDRRVDAGGYLPNRSLVLWPYTRLNDPRLRWMERYLMIDAQFVRQPCKVGYYDPQGWIAYLLNGVLVRKTAVVQSGVQYPDMNSPLEVYVNHIFLELESLSPLVRLSPGDQISHEEQWSLEKTSDLNDEQTLAKYLDQRL